MLIFDGKYSGYGKDKPQQWGSLSAVRSSVADNIDVLGADKNDLILNLPFWEQAGNISHDLSSKHYDFTHAGSPNLSWVGEGIRFTSTTNAQTSLTGFADSPRTGDFCVLAEIHHKVSGSYDTLFSFGSYNPQFCIDHASLLMYDSGDISLSGAFTNFRSICFQRKNGVVSGYVNGIKQLSTTYTADINESTIRIGYSGTASESFDGNVYNLTYFNTALDDSMIGLLSESPYILLRPRPYKLIFDWGVASPGWSNKIYGISPTKVYGVTPTKVIGV